MLTVTLSVPDISCNHCAQTIMKALGQQAGVQHVQVNVPTKEVTVDYDESRIGPTTIGKVLDEAGYPVKSA